MRTLSRHFLFLMLLPNAVVIASIPYTTPVNQLGVGQSLGNINTYVTLSRTTDVEGESSTGIVGNGFRESTNQRWYALSWSIIITSSISGEAVPTNTSFYPAHQETSYTLGAGQIKKTFFLPFEIGYPRAGHYLLERSAGQLGPLRVHSRLLLPTGTVLDQANLKGWKYALIRYPNGETAVLCAAATATMESHAVTDGVELVSDYEWPPGEDFALTFAYAPGNEGGGFYGSASDLLLAGMFESFQPKAPNLDDYVFRIRHLLSESERAINRYLDKARLLTPDPVINRVNAWSKINQLRLQQQYRWGSGFTNMPPSDVAVSRDTTWYLFGSNYYAQEWSKKLLEFWLTNGLEPNGKFTEYVMASRDPLFSDDYGLNVNDNTPLMIIAASRYYSLSGDRGFLYQAYPSLLRAAEWLQSQRKVGTGNHYGLLWCTSLEKGVRGLCTWRNVIPNYTLTGAVTELNSEAYDALLAISDLAGVVGDTANQSHYKFAAKDLQRAINLYLRPQDDPRAPYYRNIDATGTVERQETADELFPLLYGISDKTASDAILNELFGDHFFVTGTGGVGGFRTVSSAEKEYEPRGYSVLGGIWPNIGLWLGRAASARHRPDLALKAIRATALLTEVPNPGPSHLVPGEFPECFDGESFRQRGELSSPFVYGIFVWSSLESFLGITPHPRSLSVNPELPREWGWTAASHIPYKGTSLTLLAIKSERTLYTTTPVVTGWNTVLAKPELQDHFRFEPRDETFGIVLPKGTDGLEIIAVSSVTTELTVVDTRTEIEVMRVKMAAGEIVRKRLPHGQRGLDIAGAASP